MSVPVAASGVAPIKAFSSPTAAQLRGPLFLISGVFSPVPVAQNLAGGIVGLAYSETISAQGGASPYTFAVILGSLPAGLSLNSSTGVISGTPTSSGTSNFTIKVTDSAGHTGSQAFQIIIGLPSAGGSFVFLG